MVASTYVDNDNVDVLLTPSATAHALSSYVQLTANAPSAEGLVLSVSPNADTGGRYLVTIATGASGSEEPLVSNLAMNILGYRSPYALQAYLPIRVPAGRLAAACRCSIGGAPNVAVAVSLVRSGALYPVGYHRCDTFGADTTTTSGTTTITGAYGGGARVEFVASTARAYRAWGVSFGSVSDTGGIALMSLYVGASGSEVRASERVGLPGQWGNASVALMWGPYPCAIPASTRVSLAFDRNVAVATPILHLFA
jgi:hypothetical protein